MTAAADIDKSDAERLEVLRSFEFFGGHNPWRNKEELKNKPIEAEARKIADESAWSISNRLQQ